jgi:rubrerythrin
MIQFERIEDLLATAQSIEIGAAERYAEYAEKASKVNPETAALFKRLAEEEQEHENKVIELAEEASVDLSNCTVSEQYIPSGNNEESSQANNSLYQILAAAVKREELAFEVYSQIAASSNDDDLSYYAEILAKEELGHAALLRAMRRRVYDRHKAQSTILLPDPDKLKLQEEFLVIAYTLEKSLATYAEKLTDSGLDMSTCKEHSELIISQLLDDLDRSTGGTDLNINKLDDLSNQKMLSSITTFTLDNLLAECESAYEYYDSFILNTGNEDIMEKALVLASQALTQINLLQTLKNNIANK